MFRLLRRKAILLSLCLLAVLAAHTTTEAAAPRLVMVYGTLLPKPIVIDDWQGIGDKLYWGQGLVSKDGKIVDLRHTNDFEPSDLKDRPYLDLALFWGSEWVRYVEDGKPLDRLKPDDAERSLPGPASRGRFYPACGDGAPAISLYTGIHPAGYTFKRLSPEALKLLTEFGVPIRTDCPSR